MNTKKIERIFFHLETCWKEAQNLASIPMSIYSNLVLTILLFSKYNISLKYILSLGILIVILMFLLGHWIIISGFRKRKISWHNAFNTELMEIHNERKKG